MPKKRDSYSYSYGTYYSGYYSRADKRDNYIIPFAFATLIILFDILLAFGIVSLPDFFLPVLVVTTIVYILTLIDLKIGIGIMILAIGISPEFKFFGVHNLRLEDFIIPVIFFSWISRYVSKKEEFAKTNLKSPILFYLFFSAISAFIGMAYAELPLKNAFFYYFKIVEYFMIFLLIINNIKTKEEIRTFIIIVLIVSSIVGVYGIFQYMSLRGAGRVSGPQGETANVLGGYFIFHMAIGLGLFLSMRTLSKRILAALYFVILSIPFLYTFSRTSYVALLCGIFLIGIFKNKKVLIGMAVVMIILPFIIPIAVLDRARTILDVFGEKGPPSWEARTGAWKRFLSSSFESPLFSVIGRGLGSTRLGDVDNEYVKQLRDTGLIGLFIFLWLLLRIAKLCFKGVKLIEKKEELLYGFMVGYLCGFFALIIHGIAVTSFTVIRIMEPFMITTGLAVALCNLYRSKEKEPLIEIPEPSIPRKKVRSRLA